MREAMKSPELRKVVESIEAGETYYEAGDFKQAADTFLEALKDYAAFTIKQFSYIQSKLIQ